MDVVNTNHQRIVEAGGGIYVAGMFGHLVLFNSPRTRSTCSLPEKDLTPEAVSRSIAQSDKQFGL